MDDDTTPKPDVLSRETSVGEGQMEKMPSTEEQTPGNSNEVNGITEDQDESPRGVAGYAHLAEFMSKTQLGMVRKYKELSMLNLLYLQAEIHDCRTEWEFRVASDARDTETARGMWDYHWWAMSNGEASGLGGQRWEAWLKLRGRLYEYCTTYLFSFFSPPLLFSALKKKLIFSPFLCKDDAIQKHERIVALPSPNSAQRRDVSEYIMNEDLNGGKANFRSAELRGEDPEAYREKWQDDLVVFEHGAESMDAFAQWVTEPLMQAAHSCWLGRGKVRVLPFLFFLFFSSSPSPPPFHM